MTEIINMTAPVREGKDPNDARDDPGFIEAVDKAATVIDLKAYRASDKKGKRIPPREWIWNKWIGAGIVTGLSGPPGVAKSTLAQQICTHASVGIPLLRDDMTQVPALHVTCEDDEDELDRRQAQICDALKIELPQELHLMSWVGEDTLLVFLENNLFIRTPRFNALDEYIGDHGIKLVTLDLIPDFWNGNEINRTQVNTLVKTHLAYLAQRHKAAIVPLSHPSVRGMADGSGNSGSTAWEGSYRGRIYLSRVKDDDIKSDERIISRPKANYASLDETEMTWKDGYLWGRNTADKIDPDQKSLQIFLEILQYCNKKDIEVSPSSNTKRYFGKTFPDIWKIMDGRHGRITQRQMEKAYLKASLDGVLEETKRTTNVRPRLIFIGYQEAQNL